MENPLVKLATWLNTERVLGNPFPQEAVLSTTATNGLPRSRMVGITFDAEGIPKFYTSPSTKKVRDISFQKNVSLTFAFQASLCSVNIESQLSPLSKYELETDWLKLSPNFRQNYLVFGHQSSLPINSLVVPQM